MNNHLIWVIVVFHVRNQAYREYWMEIGTILAVLQLEAEVQYWYSWKFPNFNFSPLWAEKLVSIYTSFTYNACEDNVPLKCCVCCPFIVRTRRTLQAFWMTRSTTLPQLRQQAGAGAMGNCHAEKKLLGNLLQLHLIMTVQSCSLRKAKSGKG